MINRKKISVISLILQVSLCLFPGLGLHGASMYDPSLSWESIETPHFSIHFHQGLEETARRLAVIAERVHGRLALEIGWKPERRTDIIVVDNTDMANGFATPLFNNRIQIYAVRPMPGSVLSNFDDWLEMAFTHEYTHILDMDMVSWIPAGTRVVPGRVCFPNACLPLWTLEGSAVYHESKNSGFGRNKSPFTDMVIRTEVLSDNFKAIDEASHFPRRWPRGNVPYLYGGLFIEYLERAYGTGSIEKFFHENSDNIVPYSDNIYPIPYFYNKDVKDVYRKSFPVLWKEWEAYIRSKYLAQAQEIRKNGTTGYTAVSAADSDSTIPRFSRDGKSVYYIAGSPYGDSHLVRFDMNEKRNYRIARVNDPNSLALSPQGPLYLADAEFHETFSLYYDIHVYDGGYRKITRGLRGSSLDIFPDGKRAVIVREKRMKYSLETIDLSFTAVTPIIRETALQLGNPRVSPDGGSIVLTVKDLRGFTDLVLYTFENNTFRRITNDRFADIDPAWHPDGKRIVFSSDRDGVYNLYEYRIHDGSLEKLTSLLGGAFSPDVSRDGGSLVFSSYEARGNRIAVMDYPGNPLHREKLESAPLDPGFFAVRNPESPDLPWSRHMVPEPYNPLYSLVPAIRLPQVSSQEIYPKTYDLGLGAILLGGDAFLNHVYYLDAIAWTDQKRMSLTAAYTFSSLYPDITMGYRDDTLFFGKDEFPWADKHEHEIQRELRRFGFMSLFFPFINFNFQQYVQLSYIYEKVETDRYFPGYGVERASAAFPRVQWLYIFNSTRIYTWSISRENGRTVTLLADYYHKTMGSDDPIIKGRGEYTEFLPGPFRNNVIMARLRGGYSKNNQPYLSQYNLGKFARYSSDDPLEKSDWGLRGYPSGSRYGDYAAMGTLEYRFPLFQRDYGVKTFPAMFRDLWAGIFYEYGNVWSTGADVRDPEGRRNFFSEFKSSAGIELYLKLTVGYQADLAGFLGYARGFNEGGEKQVYGGVTTPFDSLLNLGRVKKRMTYL